MLYVGIGVGIVAALLILFGVLILLYVIWRNRRRPARGDGIGDEVGTPVTQMPLPPSGSHTDFVLQLSKCPDLTGAVRINQEERPPPIQMPPPPNEPEPRCINVDRFTTQSRSPSVKPHKANIQTIFVQHFQSRVMYTIYENVVYRISYI